MYIEITKCRVCGSSDLSSILDLGIQSLTGVFPADPDVNVPAGPVQLVRCVSDGGCGLVQLRQSYEPELMYGKNYGYQSSLNSDMVKHLHGKVRKIQAMNILNDGDIIVDIGSNDATTLKGYHPRKFRLVGIDPTGEKFRKHYSDSIFLIPDFFSDKNFQREFGNEKAKVITSFSMFYDLEDPVDFAHQVANCLDERGIWVFEQSYLPSMLKTNSFDTICHEHLEFYALKQIVFILEKVGMKVIDVEFNDVNGGSFSVTAALEVSELVPNFRKISEILAKEKSEGMDDLNTYQEFAALVHDEKNKLTALLKDLKSDGKSVFALGASTKGNVLLQYYDIGSNIEAIGEVNSDKYGKFTPGTNIPIISEDDILKKNPDYLLVLPWHFKEFFLKSEKFTNVKLIFPLPSVSIV